MMTDKELIQIYTTWFQKEPESRDKDEILNELLGDECQYKKAYPYHQLKPLVEKIKEEIEKRKQKQGATTGTPYYSSTKTSIIKTMQIYKNN